MTTQDEVMRVGPLLIDFAGRSVALDDDGELRLLPVTRLEFDVLAMLGRAGGDDVRRAKLLDAVWGRESDVSDHAIDTTMSTLRSKLGERRGLIETVRGVGYRLRIDSATPSPPGNGRAPRERRGGRS